MNEWFHKAESTEKIDPDRAEYALSELYRILSIPTPEKYYFYESPYGALDDFEHWQGEIGRLESRVWESEVSLIDPECSWMRLVEQDDKLNLSGRFSWFDSVVRDIEFEYKDIWTLFEEITYHDFPGIPYFWENFVFLGPFPWLIKEIVSRSFFFSHQGRECNREFFDILCRFVEECGFVFVFENLWIILDRPEFIKTDFSGKLHSDSGPALRFRDGKKIVALNGEMVHWNRGKTRKKRKKRRTKL